MISPSPPQDIVRGSVKKDGDDEALQQVEKKRKNLTSNRVENKKEVSSVCDAFVIIA